MIIPFKKLQEPTELEVLRSQVHFLRDALSQSIQQHEKKMEKWLKVQNEHKAWTQELVNDLFQREHGHLKNLTNEAVLQLNALNEVAKLFEEKGYPFPEDIRQEISKKMLDV